MPRMTVTHATAPKVKGQGQKERDNRDFRWMEEVKVREEEEGGLTERGREQQSSSHQPPADARPRLTLWSDAVQTLRTLRPWRRWLGFAPAGAVWLLCHAEAQLHLVSWCRGLLLMLVVWMVLGGCVHALKRCLQPGHKQSKVEPLQQQQQEEVTESRNIPYLWASQWRCQGLHLPLAIALANSLLLCILQEPLPDPSVPHIQALLSRLESVSHTLEKADSGSDVTLQETDVDSTLMDTVKLICSYLQQRMRTLRTLVQVQGDFEDSVRDMLQGLDGLWAQLEQLHTEVTLTKEGSQSHEDVASARTDAENLFSVLGHYRNRLQSCQTHLKDSTQLLQELTWSHSHISNSVSSSSESVWPELLLQSNIEQFDKVQESFSSVEQQTSTFQAHLEGLRKGNQDGHVGPLDLHANGVNSCSSSPRTSPDLHDRRTSAVSLEVAASTSASSADADSDAETDARRSLCERSASHFSSTFGRLRKSGRRK